MGFMEGFKKLTQPYDEDDDFFEGADKPKAAPASAAPVSGAQAEFEKTFGMDGIPSAPEPASRKNADPAAQDSAGSLFGNLGGRKPRPSQRDRTVNFGGNETQILFSPKSFDDAKDLVGYLQQHRCVVMTLEGLPTDLARRMLDLCSGIALALQGKITPVSAKTFFVTPINVDIVGSLASQMENDGQYF